MSVIAKPLSHAERGYRGAAVRWSNPENRKVVRLDSLSPQERALVLALIDAKKASAVDDAA